jgi:hypothetical protein
MTTDLCDAHEAIECWNNLILYCFTDRIMEYWGDGLEAIGVSSSHNTYGENI